MVRMNDSSFKNTLCYKAYNGDFFTRIFNFQAVRPRQGNMWFSSTTNLSTGVIIYSNISQLIACSRAD